MAESIGEVAGCMGSGLHFWRRYAYQPQPFGDDFPDYLQCDQSPRRTPVAVLYRGDYHLCRLIGSVYHASFQSRTDQGTGMVKRAHRSLNPRNFNLSSGFWNSPSITTHFFRRKRHQLQASFARCVWHACFGFSPWGFRIALSLNLAVLNWLTTERTLALRITQALHPVQ